MYCKLEGKPNHYVPCSHLRKDDISEIVEIQFNELKKGQLKKLAEGLDWGKLTKLKKIHVISSEFDGYNFTSNSLPKLEVIEFEDCRLSGQTLNSLLDAVPEIDKKTNFTLNYDEASESPSLTEAFERIKKILQRNSGKNTVGYVKEEEDEDEDNSNSNTLSGHVYRQGLINNKIDDDDDSFDIINFFGEDGGSVDSNESVSTFSENDAARLSGRDEELQSADEVVSINVTYKQPQLSTSVTSMPISCPLTIDEFNKLPAEMRNSIDTMKIIGKGQGGPDVGTSLDWSNLTGLRELCLTGVTVNESLDQTVSFEILESIHFEKCGVDCGALNSFYISSGFNLNEIKFENLFGLGPNGSSWRILTEKENNRISHIAKSLDIYATNSASSIQKKVNPRRSTSMNLRADLGPISKVQSQRSTMPPPPPPTPIYSENSQLKGASSSSHSYDTMKSGFGRGSHGNTITTGRNSRQSLDSSNSVEQSGNLGHNRFGRVKSSADFFHGDRSFGRFKPSVQQPEMVVENEAAIRDYDQLCDDTHTALNLIQQWATAGHKNYSCVKIEEAISIVYKNRDNSFTPILDANIDTVRVHRGWREVDKKISNEARAKIIIESLGIPPCPPDIYISAESSKLGRAIRKEFNKLKIEDEPGITVTKRFGGG